MATAIDRYLELIREFPLRPLRSEADLDRAQTVLDELTDRGSKLTAAEKDYLHVLSLLVEAYEDVHHPIPDVSGVEMIRYFMEDRGLTQAATAAGTGISAPTLSALLAGKRRLNTKHVEALGRFFAVNPGVFLD